MKKYYLIVLLFIGSITQAQIVNIPDANFKNALVNTNCVDTDGDDLPDADADTNNDGEIQVSEAEAVLTLWVNDQNIISLEGIESFINILHLLCYNNQITSLDTSHQTNLRYLNFHDNLITSVDFSQNPDLRVLYCANNQLTSLDLTQNTELFELYCGSNNLLNLDISQNINLEYLSCYSNQLSSLDVSQNILLRDLICMHNQITSLDITQNPLIVVLYCNDNLLYNLNAQNGNSTIMEVFFAQDNPNLYCIQVDDEIFANNQQGWQKDDWAEYSEDCTDPNPIVYIPDANFKYALTSSACVDINGDGFGDIDADLNDDGEIQISEAELVYSLRIGFYQIESIEGIEYFVNLESFYCSNNEIISPDFSQNTNLEIIVVGMNRLISIDVSQNPNLKVLYVDHNWDLFNIDITNCINLEVFNSYSTPISSLDFSQNINLKDVQLGGGEFTSLDFSSNPNLERLIANIGPSLTALDIKNGNNTVLDFLRVEINSNLTCIQVDDVDDANSRNCNQSNFSWCKNANSHYSEDCQFGIDDFGVNGFTLYPNPTQEVLFIKSQQQIETVKIYSLQGQLIKEESKNRIDVSELKAGIYFVKVTIEGNSITKKFIKN